MGPTCSSTMVTAECEAPPGFDIILCSCLELLPLSQMRKPVEEALCRASIRYDLGHLSSGHTETPMESSLGTASLAELGVGSGPQREESLPCYKTIHCILTPDGHSKPQTPKRAHHGRMRESSCWKSPGTFSLADGDIIQGHLKRETSWW